MENLFLGIANAELRLITCKRPQFTTHFGGRHEIDGNDVSIRGNGCIRDRSWSDRGRGHCKSTIEWTRGS
jgi:hypothetical protein